jgi:hypothetical protein
LETSAWMTVKKCGYRHCEDGWDIVISGVHDPGFATRELIRYVLGRYIVRVGNGWNWLRIVCSGEILVLVMLKLRSPLPHC